MLHTIGRKELSEELVDLLLACHGRIRSFIKIAAEIGERMDLSDDAVIEGSARVLRYFSEALPLHEADEEEGVLPRLYGRSPELDAALDRTCDDHERHAGQVRRLREVCASVGASPRDARARASLAAVARQLCADFERHLDMEERSVFPAIRSLLTPDERRAIVRELRARRLPP